MLAYDYPLLGVFWTMMFWFLWIAWIVILIRVIADIFRSHDLGGGAKALWVIFVIVIPWLGVLVYLIARGHKIAEHDADQRKAQEAAFHSYVQDTVSSGGGGGTADELAKLADLKAQGILSDAEFAQQKAKLLA